MMRAFQLAQEQHLDLSPELADLFTRNLGVVTRDISLRERPARNVQAPSSRAKARSGRVLRMMHRVDFLGRYIPEFGQLTCLVQHEFFHRYTADEHTLVCIEKLDALMQTEDPKLLPYRKLFEKLEDPLVLYLALLLHDTGKAVGARPHSEASALFAQRVASRLQLSSEQRKSLILLVDHHLTLSNIAQQRNLDDPETAVEFAHIVKDQNNLDALMLLTLADGQGTSADAWSDWKESLVWQLYHATSQYLADQKAFYEQTKIERELLQKQRRREALALITRRKSRRISSSCRTIISARLRSTTLSRTCGCSVDFLENFTCSDEPPLAPAIEWEAFSGARPQHRVVLHLGSASELLAKIAGSFSVVPINILSADIYSRGDNVVLDVFRVCDAQIAAVTDERDGRPRGDNAAQRRWRTRHFDFAPLLEKRDKESRSQAARDRFCDRDHNR